MYQLLLLLLLCKPRQRRSQILLHLLSLLVALLLLLFPQLVHPHPLLVDDIPLALLAQVLLQRAILSSRAVANLLGNVHGLGIQILLGLALRVGPQIDVADEVGVHGNHLGRQLVQQAADLGLLSLLVRLKGVGLEGVEVGLSGAGDDDGGEALVVAYAEDIFKGAPADALDRLALAAPFHVGVCYSLLGGGVLVEEALPDGRRGAPADGCEAGI